MHARIAGSAAESVFRFKRHRGVREPVSCEGVLASLVGFLFCFFLLEGVVLIATCVPVLLAGGNAERGGEPKTNKKRETRSRNHASRRICGETEHSHPRTRTATKLMRLVEPMEYFVLAAHHVAAAGPQQVWWNADRLMRARASE